MRSCKLLFLFAFGLLCVSINAKLLKRQKKILQRPVCTCAPASCSGPISFLETPCGSKALIEPTYGGMTCNCQNIFLDELPNYECRCKYDTYNILKSELPCQYEKVPVIKLPKLISNCELGASIPAINLPGLYDLVVDLPYCPSQAMPPYIADLPSRPCQAPINSYQFIETPCSCRAMQAPIVEYLSPVEVPSSILKVPAEPYYIQAPKCQPQIIQLPCECQKDINCPCSCDKGLRASYGLTCGCQNPVNCGCQNGIQYGAQLPALDIPCVCQACQQSPLFGYGCQSLPPPVIGCRGKYLRQMAIPPPFL